MNKYLRILLLISIVALTPFVYLYMRDFVYAGSEDTDHDVTSCVPYDLETEEERFSVTLKWKTKGRCPGYVKYDISSKNKDGQTVPSTEGFLPVVDHQVVVEDLKPETTYYFWIYSDGKAYGEDGEPYPVRL